MKSLHRDADGAIPVVEARPEGLYLADARLWLDARDAPGTVFVSHAHSDHCSRAARILCTPETEALTRPGGPRSRAHGCHATTIPIGSSLALEDADVTLLSASHTLGSAMVVAETGAGRAAYTGDYKLRPNPFAPPPSIPRCDTLVMECTFGAPRYRFPPDEELLERLFAFIDAAQAVGATPVVLAYAFGKGQEALWHLTRRGYDVVVHGAIARLSAAHEALGFPFPGPGRWERYVRGEVRGRVLLTTPSTRKTPMVTKIEPRRVVQLTGWALHPGAHNIYRDCDLVLPLSDHADFDDLVRTARESGARRIFTTHGPTSFAAILRSLGMDAEHLTEHPQAMTQQEGGDAPQASDGQMTLL